MTGASFTYLIEGGDLDEGAAEVAEGEIKPQGAIDLDEGMVRAVTVASWIKARRHVLADVTDLQRVIRERLTYLVQRRIERELLSGDGAGEHIRGILNRTGVAEVDRNGMPNSDAILRGLTTVGLSNATPTGVVLNPLAYESMLTERDDAQSRLDSPGAFCRGSG
jgi:HK97 family phage major capsid protein